MDTTTFNKFKEIVYEKSGISLDEGKEPLVSARVGKRMRILGIQDPKAYVRYLGEDKGGDETVNFIDAISTNVTSFFRESSHFDFLNKVVSEWLAQGQRRFRFWSAASSTGEEPYTLAVTLLEATKGFQVDMKILATDISTKVLEKCRTGNYEKEKLATVSLVIREKYFDQKHDGKTCFFTAKSILKDLVVFNRLNLMNQTFPMKGPFDVIFCRNVMIYFDQMTRKNLVKKMSFLLKPGGYLMVGHSESLTGISDGFKAVKPSIYYKELITS